MLGFDLIRTLHPISCSPMPSAVRSRRDHPVQSLYSHRHGTDWDGTPSFRAPHIQVQHISSTPQTTLGAMVPIMQASCTNTLVPGLSHLHPICDRSGRSRSRSSGCAPAEMHIFILNDSTLGKSTGKQMLICMEERKQKKKQILRARVLCSGEAVHI